MKAYRFRPPYKAMFAVSIVIALAGIAIIILGIQKDVPWPGRVMGGWCVLIGSLLARMNYRAFRHGLTPRPASSLLLVAVLVSAELWIAFTIGILHL